MVLDQTWISLTSALTALIASVAGPVVTLRVGRQQFRANVLSVNRQRWIETLRDALADLVGQLQAASSIRQATPLPSFASIGSDPVILARVEALIRTVAKIELLLNPLEADQQRLHKRMLDAIILLRGPAVEPDLKDRIDLAVTQITETAQVILKREWIRVKTGR